VITNDVSDYINLLARIAHIICNQPLYRSWETEFTTSRGQNEWYFYASAQDKLVPRPLHYITDIARV